MIDNHFFKRSNIQTLGQTLGVLLENKGHSTLISNLEALPIDIPLSHIGTLKNAVSGDLSFFSNKKYKADFENTKARIIITNQKHFDDIKKNTDKIIIVSPDPYSLYALIAQALYIDNTMSPSLFCEYYQDGFGAYIHKTAILEKNVITAPNVTVGAHCQIGENTILESGAVIKAYSKIGRNCKISTNATISYSLLGDNVLVASGAVIGSKGFGYAMGESHITVPQLGRTILQDNVHIGANSCVDRGAIDDTIVGDGTRIDNLVQIAHNVTLGRHCIIAGGSAIAGSTYFEDYVVCGGDVSIAGHLTIGSAAQISGGSALMHDIPPKEIWSGRPAKPIRTSFKEIATLSYLAKNRHLIR